MRHSVASARKRDIRPFSCDTLLGGSEDRWHNEATIRACGDPEGGRVRAVARKRGVLLGA